jgi:phosphonoacetate hydrolase
MNHKGRCYDLGQTLANLGMPIRISISAERDKYVLHHRGLGGAAWIYLNRPEDKKEILPALLKLNGVESVLTREEAVSKFDLYGSRIGDLCVFGDQNTVFGTLEQASSELPGTYRSHGSIHELNIPLFVFNATGAPSASYFQRNLDLTRWLYRG